MKVENMFYAKLEKIFNKGLELHHYANTAYPLDHKKVWKDYKVAKEDVRYILIDEWHDVEEMCLYVHVPFCKNRCSYCEYAVLVGDDSLRQRDYVELLSREISMYKDIFSGYGSKKILAGMDIGGGTPTILSTDSLKKIIDDSLDGFNLSSAFSMSIETTPLIANDLKKMKEVRDLGIERISMGVQTIDKVLLEHVGRIDNTQDMMIKARDNIRNAGFDRFNIDVMYGFLNQSEQSFEDTLRFVMDLAPEYITLYRNRYKGTKLENEAQKIKLCDVNRLYEAAYDILTKNGYSAGLGKNTFSKVQGDVGTSAYLTKRVIEGMPYLGLGLGSQSMSRSSIYYNQGAASKSLKGYESEIRKGDFPIQDIYSLPMDEMMAKMISVSFYFGSIDVDAFNHRFRVDFKERFKDTVDFLSEKGLMYFCEKGGCNQFALTKDGKDYVNGIIPLFYSQISQDNLLNKEIPAFHASIERVVGTGNSDKPSGG